ncbi:hypothetical protein EVAR_8098_1 [Eumeta japonica]|uniref:Uncharacterized protein n=1 Tax=Eumeta variegata TaxID=151549 RepID=A0A4C1TSQ5_EUMVA|nr:hypothetical protein EVAR_8098_1 [Eumeta japonica]
MGGTRCGPPPPHSPGHTTESWHALEVAFTERDTSIYFGFVQIETVNGDGIASESGTGNRIKNRDRNRNLERDRGRNQMWSWD